MSNDWQQKYYSSPVSRLLARHGLIEAPTRETPSDAMLQLREQNARAAERDAAWCAQQAAAERVRREREEHEELRGLVEQHGSETVERYWRLRIDPNFELPVELQNIQPRTEKKT